MVQFRIDRKKKSWISTRLIYLSAAVVVILLGLGSRRFREFLPAFMAEYAGDTLWALLMFLLVSMIAARRPLVVRACAAAGLAGLVELSQLYHAEWIDSIRQTTLGGLILGFGFLWTDLVCYLIGIASGCVAEWLLARWYRSRRQ